nr:hypothetical protein Q903MT_gene6239 [Picea sitchensis]
MESRTTIYLMLHFPLGWYPFRLLEYFLVHLPNILRLVFFLFDTSL